MKILTIIFLLLGLSVCVGGNAMRHDVPMPAIVTLDLGDSFNVWIGSDGQYYYELRDYQRTSFGKDTLEEACESARDWIEWKMENAGRTFSIIGTYPVKEHAY